MTNLLNVLPERNLNNFHTKGMQNLNYVSQHLYLSLKMFIKPA